MARIVVIIPAYNEENSVGRVIQDIPMDLVQEVIVVNNNSNDETATVAKSAGATVLHEQQQGYGFACLKGIDYLKKMEQKPDIVVFLDADYSDHPEELPQIVAPILKSDVEMVIGSRALGDKEQGSMTPQQVFGNWLATMLIKWFYGVVYTDLGPFRAIKYDRLIDLNMCDETYGWTVEMQVKAAKQGLKTTEIPVSYRVRVGKSKISGTIKGTILAGYKIITTIFKYK
ncbi:MULTISPECIES: glycosyltransferase family 2 protein [unclassified Aureispira]|uniref:glycosyltransferase family 2 protein n=1 Tax=unclassified Aureispira TaxID=2649989 RepID=UPI0006983AFF|nr:MULTISPECIES: glycosyltransferase family 2 protein [unclassified Aureispira]WMX12225.1 glycosyltransferase family 2 protein [Aureispira sp. CCB-E]